VFDLFFRKGLNHAIWYYSNPDICFYFPGYLRTFTNEEVRKIKEGVMTLKASLNSCVLDLALKKSQKLVQEHSLNITEVSENGSECVNPKRPETLKRWFGYSSEKREWVKRDSLSPSPQKLKRRLFILNPEGTGGMVMSSRSRSSSMTSMDGSNSTNCCESVTDTPCSSPLKEGSKCLIVNGSISHPISQLVNGTDLETTIPPLFTEESTATKKFKKVE